MNWMKRTAFAAIKAGLRIPARSEIERIACLTDTRDVLKRLRIDCVLDVGANQGQFGRNLRAIGYEGWIVSFEPSPTDLEILRRHADPKWLSYQLALAHEDGERTFNLTGHSVFNSFLTPLASHSLIVEKITVKMRRLEGLIGEILERTHATRLFLKMDTQGFDAEVVKGAGPRIADFWGMLSELSVKPIYEGMPHYTEVLRFYESLGFSLHSLHIVNRVDDGAVLEYDGLFTRA